VIARKDVFAAWTTAGVKPNHGLAFRRDEEIEDLFLLWVKNGSPSGSAVRIDNGPSGATTLWVVPP